MACVLSEAFSIETKVDDLVTFIMKLAILDFVAAKEISVSQAHLVLFSSYLMERHDELFQDSMYITRGDT